MQFGTVCRIGIAVAALFGLAFLVAPVPALSLYGITGMSPGAVVVARLFGIEFLFFVGGMLAAKSAPDNVVPGASIALAVASVLGAVVAAHATLTGTTNALGWSTVLIYAFFAFAFGRLALSRP